ncbi:MAG TPA: polyprenol phosphomannose-dependent alpha 1,6 mannosyltransferase MptB, partial [Gemmataceae bacterium]|nr:polyprenol phosphomannose-dependent alpha 1,6 mannosyltransferase MptB [Gemmataceae bacterium]
HCSPSLSSSKSSVVARAGWRAWLLVCACAGVSLVLYALLLSVIPGLSSAEPSYAAQVFPWVRPLSKGDLARARADGEEDLHLAAASRFLVLVAVLFAVYALMLAVTSRPFAVDLERFVFGAGASFLVLQTSGPAMLSSDVYSYAMQGRIAVRGGNPYADAPALRADDPYLQHAPYSPSPYGPLWVLLSSGVATIGGTHLGPTVLMFRSVAISGVLAAAALIWSCLRRIAPQQCARGLVFFLWNPLVVLEAGLSGHNDMVMLALLITAVWLHMRGRPVAASIAWCCSALVKFVTGVLLPLYLLLVLRGLPSRRARYRFLGTVLVGVILACGLGLAWTRIKATNGRRQAGAHPLAALALGAESTNNVHELLFPRLREVLGDDPELVRAPLHFEGWWVAANATAVLRSARDPVAAPQATLAPGRPLLVLVPPGTDWLYVYDHNSGRSGYVQQDAVREIERPTMADTDPVLAQLAAGPAESPVAKRANLILRSIAWLAFGVLWLAVAWRTADFRALLVGSVTLLLASYWLLGSWFWPWYVTWALALGALVPTSCPARVAALLSATVLTLYASIGAPEPFYTYRSIAAIVLPLTLVLLVWVAKRAFEAARSRLTWSRVANKNHDDRHP